ncbi:guanine nucleotide exchange factor MSS4 [Ischnura elegans]|uniref:guanine nucleotide exchange factor MSS4 n=1 Tax=Ischnura elegans TaxID=197161 RepID=UPI001ED8BBB7|nr:guanine nucleotide exchange factor MSS4 [Ischnura elegans]XP_046385061.1 guanine nucleotide exchange factor MSS4 [Ischnura elegans]
MSSEETSPKSVDDLVMDGKNCKTVMCLHCPSKILAPRNGEYRKVEFSLPEPRRKKVVEGEADSPKEELLSDFWLVEDMYRFENMGFSNSVGNIKYLACADCEMGPIGLYEMDTKRSFVAIARVQHTA